MAEKEEKKPKNTRTGGVILQSISSEMRESYLDYAMSVITTRALPDVRDGLKPVHRRILFAMQELGLSHSSRFRKSATVVGNVLGRYHPHGDSAVYEAMVKMAQDFSYRHPLITGQGNFGSIDGDGAAAMRYTEVKMSALSGELLRDLEKETVTWRQNYDNTRKEPSVLPSAYPNMLVNGTLGIAVGMATNIPPHNLREVCDATIHLIDNKNATNDDLIQFIQGPDFPIGGIVYDKKDIQHAYANGKGGVVVRGKAEITETKKGTFQIIIYSIPFRVNKSDLIIKIADLVRDKKIEGIKDIRDESTKEIRIVIDLKVGAQPQKILNAIYKHTQLEDVFHFNMVALVDGTPKTLSLKSILEEFIKHRKTVTKRRLEFDLNKARNREHILVGLNRALDHIDQIIKTIRASKDTPTAHKNLITKFKFSKKQATAILEMRLQKLAGLEREKITLELSQTQTTIRELTTILASVKKMLGIIKEELRNISEKYGNDRRTKIVKGGVKNISLEDLVPEEESVLVLTRGGYIKRTNPNEYKKQRRGGVGVIDLNIKEEDFITTLLTTSTHNDLLFFSDRGKVYQTKMYDVPEGRRATKGKSIMNYLSLTAGERITSVVPIDKSVKKDNGSLLMVTRSGIVKKVASKSFLDVRRSGLIAIKLAKGDELISASFVSPKDEVSIVTSFGQSIRFKVSDVREMGRTASGVRGIKLSNGDVVINADVARKDEKHRSILVLSTLGYGKKTPLKEYKIQNRGGRGMKTIKVTKKTGTLIASKIVVEDEGELVAISKKGQVIRVDLSEIPSLGRQTQGVRIMKLRPGDRIASLICF